jgi:lipoprotein-anchoring transpeptidase ErfK/SrfK
LGNGWLGSLLTPTERWEERAEWMSIKTVSILILLILAVAAGVVFFTMWKEQQAENLSAQHLLQGRSLLESEEYEKAVTVLTSVLEQNPKFTGRMEALYELGRAYREVSPEQAVAVWTQWLNEYSDSARERDVRLNLGLTALEMGRTELAEQSFNWIVENVPGSMQGRAKLGLAQIAEAEGERQKARDLYYEVLEEHGSEDYAGLAMDRLSEINTELIFSSAVSEFTQRYEIQPGDTPIAVGARFDTTAYLIKAMNNLDDNNIRAGRRVTVPRPGGVRIVVDKGDRHLYLYSQMEGSEGRFIKRYPVGVAKHADRTPPGIYVIKDKMIDPVWYPPEGGRIPAGDPRNALGSRWLGFTQDGRDTSLGIHGNNDPETIGTNASAGCIRMYNSEVEELFMIARQGTEVEIVE